MPSPFEPPRNVNQLGLLATSASAYPAPSSGLLFSSQFNTLIEQLQAEHEREVQRWQGAYERLRTRSDFLKGESFDRDGKNQNGLSPAGLMSPVSALKTQDADEKAACQCHVSHWLPRPRGSQPFRVASQRPMGASITETRPEDPKMRMESEASDGKPPALYSLPTGMSGASGNEWLRGLSEAVNVYDPTRLSGGTDEGGDESKVPFSIHGDEDERDENIEGADNFDACRGSLASEADTIVTPIPRGGRASQVSAVFENSNWNFEVRSAWREEANAELDRRGKSLMAMSQRSRSGAFVDKASASALEEDYNSCWPIHPSSPVRLCWDLLGIAMIAYDIFMIPMQVLDPEETTFLVFCKMMTLTYWTTDLPLSFITGYHKNGHVVMDKCMVATHYVRTWLMLDLIIVGVEWFMLVAGGTGSSETRMLRSLKFLRFLRTAKLLRLLKLRRILQEVDDRINNEATSIYFNVVKIILFLLAVNHIIACCWFGIGRLNNEAKIRNWIQENNLVDRPLLYRYTTSMHWSLTQFTPASMEIYPYNVGERSFSIVVLLFALVAFSSFVSSLTSSMTHLRHIRTNETRQFWLLRRYLKDANIPSNLSLRIQRYLEYAFAKVHATVQASEVPILQMLSGPLRLELEHEAFVIHLYDHPLFHEMGARNKIFFNVVTSVSLARGDILFSMGEAARAMWFVISGTMEYTLMNGTVDTAPAARNIEDGTWLAEPVLWTSWVHLGDSITVAESSIMTVDAEKFCVKLMSNPALRMRARLYAIRFVEALNRIEPRKLTDLTENMLRPDEIMAGVMVPRISLDSHNREEQKKAKLSRRISQISMPRLGIMNMMSAASSVGTQSLAVTQSSSSTPSSGARSSNQSTPVP